jgi:hypothetical protein
MTSRKEPADDQAASGLHQRRPSTLSESWSNLAGSPKHTNILKEDLAMQSLTVPRGGIAQRVREHIQQAEISITTGLNLRDVGGTAPDTIRPGQVFRSSQVFREEELSGLRLTSALDLREEPHACRKAAEKSVTTGIAVAPLELLPDRLRLHAHRSLPMACTLCSGTEVSRSGVCPNLYHFSLQVFHVDLLPSRLKLQIFVDMPWRIRLATIAAPFKGKSPQQVMTPAVADPAKLGYLKLYKMMLDMSMRQIARALRIFAYQENLPIMVHCIHGKDRTGLIIALLLLTLGVPEEVVVLDYAKSEVELKGGRDKGQVKGQLQDWLVTDDVVASSAQTMEDTLRYLDSRYGGIRRYLRIIGITRGEVHAIRKNLLQPRHTDDNGDALSADMLSTFSMGSDLGGADVSPLSDAEQSPNTRHRRRHRRKGLAAQLE